MLYQEYAPHPALAAHVDCLWTAVVDGAVPGRGHRVLPDNCVDILWQDDGAPGFAVGMMRSAIIVPDTRPCQTIAVRFKAGAAGLFLATPLHALTDQRAALDLLWQAGEAERFSDALWAAPPSGRARLDLIEWMLLRRLRQQGQDGGALVRRALGLIDASAGLVRVEQLSDALQVSRQHLAAQFRQQVGLTPKMYARICRFRRASAALRQEGGSAHSGKRLDWSQLALEHGYFDQSHLIHDFQEFAGSTPEHFLLPR